MQNIKLFDHLNDYIDFVKDEIFTYTDMWWEVPQLRRVIQHWILERAPIFFEASDPIEYTHYTGVFGWQVMREYANPMIKDLYYLHEAFRSIFWYNLPPQRYFTHYHQWLMFVQKIENIIATQTEFLVYELAPESRKLSFPDPIMYDIIKDYDPTWLDRPMDLMTLRAYIQADFVAYPSLNITAEIGDALATPVGQKFITWCQEWHYRDEQWANLWWHGFPHKARQLAPGVFEYVSTPATNGTVADYLLSMEHILDMSSAMRWGEDDEPLGAFFQATYTRNRDRNLENAINIWNYSAAQDAEDAIDAYQMRLLQSWQPCIKLLNDQILLENLARQFNPVYAGTKNAKTT